MARIDRRGLARRRLGVGEQSLRHLYRGEVGRDFRRARRAPQRLLERLDRRGRMARGFEGEREIRPGVGGRVVDRERRADAVRRRRVLPRLVQHDAAVMERRRMAGIRLQDRVVAVERLAELALPVHGEGAIELFLELHGCGAIGRSASLDDPAPEAMRDRDSVPGDALLPPRNRTLIQVKPACRNPP